MEKYFGDISANANNWFSNPIRIVAVCIFVLGFAIMLLSPVIDKLINKKKKGNNSLSVRFAGWVTVLTATFLAVI